MKLSKQ